jgi:acetyl esterase/lipase
MRTAVVALAFLVAAASAASAQTPSMAALAEARTAVRAPDRVAAYGADPLQIGHLRLPAGEGPFPVVVLLHGGCWSAGYEDLTGMGPLAEALTAQGVATWNLAYRRRGDAGGGWPGTFEDVGAGIDHLRTLAADHPLDLTRVVVVGHSSGAHLALWGASRPALGEARFGADPIRPSAVAAIDGPGTLAGVIGIDAMVCGQPVIVPFMGGTPQDLPAAYRIASPQDQLPLGVRQLLVEAELGPLLQPYVAAAQASGDPVTSLVLEGADHFDPIVPGRPVGDRVVAAIVDLVGVR